ncbi:MAG: hypothetical protein V3S27_03850 [Kiloniellales bacterium]
MPNTYTGGPRAPNAPLRVLGGLAVAGLLLASTYTYAQPGDSAVLLGGAGEYYIAALPAGWTQRGPGAGPGVRHGDWLPAGQTLARWSDRITLQAVPELAGKAPRTFLNQITNLRGEVCDGVFATEVETAVLNGFPTGFRIIACPRDTRTDTGVIAVLRVVAGGRALYVSQRVFQVAPFAPGRLPVSGAALEAARAAIEYGVPCRRGDPARPCPEAWHPALDGLPADRALVVFPAAP